MLPAKPGTLLRQFMRRSITDLGAMHAKCRVIDAAAGLWSGRGSLRPRAVPRPYG